MNVLGRKVNSKQKELFIEEVYGAFHGHTISDVIADLNLFAEYEEQYHCDLLLLDVDIIADVVRAKEATSKTVLSRIWRTLSRYEKWSAENGFPVTGNIKSAKEISKYSVSLSVIESPRHLETMVEETFPPISENLVDNITRAIVWAIYIGIPRDDIPNLKRENFNMADGVINISHESYKIYPEAEIIFRHILKNDAVNAKIGRKIISYKKEECVLTYPSDFVRREHWTAYNSRIAAIRQKSNKGNSYLKHSVIRSNGIFYRIYVQELQGTPVKLQDLKEFKNNRNSESDKLKVDTRLSIMAEYKTWRKITHPEFKRLR